MRRGPARGAAILLALAALVLAGLAGLATQPAAARVTATPPDAPWSGYSIDVGDRAAGTFIGARRLGGRAGQVVYRVDPSADPRPGGFGPFRALARVGGAGERADAGPSAVSRGAWIVGKYGTYRLGVQSAAVDAVLLHLLVGGRYRLTGAAGQRRIAASGEAASVRRFARVMLSDAARAAGPYRIGATQGARAAVGQAVPVDVVLQVARSGRGVAGLPVQVQVDGGSWRSAGRTDAAGRLTRALPGLDAGPHAVRVRATRVPETRLRVAAPVRAVSSRIVLAGRKQTLSTQGTLAVQARPRVGMRTDSVRRGTPTRPVLGLLAGYGSAPRRAAARLHGPFTTARAASCERRGGRTLRTTLRGDGTAVLPPVTLLRAGYYTWRASVGGNRYNLPAQACTGAFRVRR